jgi:hypothetical protein
MTMRDVALGVCILFGVMLIIGVSCQDAEKRPSLRQAAAALEANEVLLDLRDQAYRSYQLATGAGRNNYNLSVLHSNYGKLVVAARTAYGRARVGMLRAVFHFCVVFRAQCPQYGNWVFVGRTNCMHAAHSLPAPDSRLGMALDAI